MGFYDDVMCWCGNSDTCENITCFRHTDNLKANGKLFIFGLLKDTPYCPLYKNEVENE